MFFCLPLKLGISFNINGTAVQQNGRKMWIDLEIQLQILHLLILWEWKPDLDDIAE